MKKFLFSTFIMSLLAVFSMAQDRIIADFEDGDTVFNVSGPNTGTIVTNPDATGINTSANVMKVDITADWDENFIVYPYPVLNFHTHPVLSFKVYATDTMSVGFRTDRPGKWQQYFNTHEFPTDMNTFTIADSDIGKWVEFTYDYGNWDNISGYNEMLKLYTSDNRRVNSFYIDDIKFIERAPAFDETSEVPVFYDPVTTIKWVGNWVSGTAANENVYRIEKDGYNMLSTDTLTLSPNGYSGWPNDTISGSSGGAAYILFGEGYDSILYHDNGLKWCKSYTSSLTLPEIPTAGVGSMQLSFDLAVMGHAYVADMAPVVEVKYPGGDWTAITISNIPDQDSTWTTVTEDLDSPYDNVSIRFSNSIAASTDTMQFWIDDIRITGTTTLTQSVAPSGEGGATLVTVGGSLQMDANATPANITYQNYYWEVDDTDIATIDKKGLLSGIADGTVTVTCMANDGSGVSGTVSIDVGDVTISVDSIIVTSNLDTLTAPDSKVAFMTATVYPANASDKTVAWSVDNNTIAVISSDGILTALNNGTVKVTATANDGTGVTGTKDIVVEGFGGSAIISRKVNTVSIYPNPVADIVNIKITDDIQSVSILALDGRAVLIDESSDTSLDVSNLKAGIYIMNIVDVNNKVYVSRFVKE